MIFSINRSIVFKSVADYDRRRARFSRIFRFRELCLLKVYSISIKKSRAFIKKIIFFGKIFYFLCIHNKNSPSKATMARIFSVPLAYIDMKILR